MRKRADHLFGGCARGLRHEVDPFLSANEGAQEQLRRAVLLLTRGYVLRFSQCLHCSSGLRELAEKRSGVSKVGRVEVFSKIAVNPGQQVTCVCASIQPTPQAAQTQRGSKLQ